MNVLVLDTNVLVPAVPIVHYKASKYVQRCAPTPMSFQCAQGLTQAFMSYYGHASIGVEKAYSTDKALQSYNRHVYDTDTVDVLRYFFDTPEGERYKDDIMNRSNELVDTCKSLDMPIYLLSDAPLNWCLPLVECLALPVPSSNIINTSNSSGLVKPQPEFYLFAEEYIRYKTKKRDVRLYYVSDRDLDIDPVKKHHAWLGIKYDPACNTLQNIGQFLLRHSAM